MTVPLSVTVGVSCPLMCHFNGPLDYGPVCDSCCDSPTRSWNEHIWTSKKLEKWKKHCMRHTEGLQLENKCFKSPKDLLNCVLLLSTLRHFCYMVFHVVLPFITYKVLFSFY